MSSRHSRLDTPERIVVENRTPRTHGKTDQITCSPAHSLVPSARHVSPVTLGQEKQEKQKGVGRSAWTKAIGYRVMASL